MSQHINPARLLGQDLWRLPAVAGTFRCVSLICGGEDASHSTHCCQFLPNDPAHQSQHLLARFPSQNSSRSVWSRSLLERLGSCALNSDTLHGVPAAPPTDHHPQLPLPPSDRDDRPHGTTDPRRAEEGLVPQGRASSGGYSLIASVTPFKLRCAQRARWC